MRSSSEAALGSGDRDSESSKGYSRLKKELYLDVLVLVIGALMFAYGFYKAIYVTPTGGFWNSSGCPLLFGLLMLAAGVTRTIENCPRPTK